MNLDSCMKVLLNVEWKPVIINGNYSLYEVSNEGDIRNITNFKIMKTFETKAGYKSIGLVYNHHRYVFLIHRLVAQAFIPNPENKPQVNHIDGNKKNNNVANLEWATAYENMNHAVTNGLLDIKGDKHPESKYTEKQIREVCKMLENGKYPLHEIQVKTSVKKDLIYQIKKGRAWRHISKDYKIKDNKFIIRITDNDVHAVCKLLENSNLTYRQISELSGVSIDNIAKISSRKVHKNISKGYNFPQRSR